LLAGVVAYVIEGNATNFLAPSFPAFVDSPTDKAVWLLITGIVVAWSAAIRTLLIRNRVEFESLI